MQKPSKRLYTQLHREEISINNLDRYDEREVWDDEDEMYDMSCRNVLFSFDNIKLPKGIKLKDCFIDVHLGGGRGDITIDVVHDGGVNLNFEKEEKEYLEWEKSVKKSWEEEEDQQEIRELEAQIAKIKAKKK